MGKVACKQGVRCAQACTLQKQATVHACGAEACDLVANNVCPHRDSNTGQSAGTFRRPRFESLRRYNCCAMRRSSSASKVCVDHQPQLQGAQSRPTAGRVAPQRTAVN
jgi:hypothetical protein